MRPADNPPNSDGLGVYYGTVPEWAVRVYWWPGPSIWQRFGLDPDPDLKWRSGTVANTNLHAVNWQPKVLECDSATLSIAQRSCASVDQTFRRHKAFGYSWVFIQSINWLSIMTISLFGQNYWPFNNFKDIFMVSVTGVWTMFGLVSNLIAKPFAHCYP